MSIIESYIFHCNTHNPHRTDVRFQCIGRWSLCLNTNNNRACVFRAIMKYITYVIICWLQIIVILCYIPRAIPSFTPFFSRKVIIEWPFAFVGRPKVLFDKITMVMISNKYFVINESCIFGKDVLVRDVLNCKDVCTHLKLILKWLSKTVSTGDSVDNEHNKEFIWQWYFDLIAHHLKRQITTL